MMYLVIDLEKGIIVKYAETEKEAKNEREDYLYWERRNNNYIYDYKVIIIKGETI